MNHDRFCRTSGSKKGADIPFDESPGKKADKTKVENRILVTQEISNILWAACGKTMKETKRSKSRRTAPSGRNSQTIKVYMATDKGLYLYDENLHRLVLIKTKDIRADLTNQKMMKNMPLGLVYVSDYSKLKGYVGTDDNRRLFVAGTETGFISQNVYLYCAAAKLNTAVIGLVNREKLHKIMGLNDDEKVIYTQAIGKSPDN